MSPLERRIKQLTRRKDHLATQLPEKQDIYDAVVAKIAVLEARLAAKS